MNLLIEYFHDSYEIGDTLIDHNVMNLCATLGGSSEGEKMVFARFIANDNVDNEFVYYQEAIYVWNLH